MNAVTCWCIYVRDASGHKEPTRDSITGAIRGFRSRPLARAEARNLNAATSGGYTPGRITTNEPVVFG